MLSSGAFAALLCCAAVLLCSTSGFDTDWGYAAHDVLDDAKNYTEGAGEAIDNATQSLVGTAEAVLEQYRNVIIGLFIPIGLVGAFLGYYLFRPFLFVGGFVMGGGFFYLAVKSTTEGTSAQSWATITATVLGGLVLGVVAVKAISVGIFLIGSSLGATIALVLRHTALYGKIIPKNPDIALFIFIAVLGILFGFVALCMEKEMVIIATSYGGAFAMVYGVGHFAGHFPDLKHLEEKDLGNTYVWVYFIAFLVVGSLGCFTQFSVTGKRNRRSKSRGWWGVRGSDEDGCESEDEHEDRRSRRRGQYNFDRNMRPKDINLNVVVNQPNGESQGHQQNSTVGTFPS